MKKVKIITFIITIGLVILFLCSCNKEPIETNNNNVANTTAECDCFEVHEAYEAVGINGAIYMQWVFKYNTTVQKDLCSKDTGTWIYTNADTQRYKTNCN